MPQSRSQGQAPPARRAGSPCGPCSCGAGAAPRPPPAEAICAGSAVGARGGWLVLGSWGLGGDEFSGVGVDVVEVGVVVLGFVRRHLHVRLQRRSAPRPPPFDPPSPPGSHAPSWLFLGARGALALALGPPSGPHAPVPLPVPWVPPPVTHALACSAGARARPVPVPLPLAAPALAQRPSLRSMHLGALPAPLRALPVPWPLPGSLPCVAPSAARTLSPSAAAGLGAPSVFAPLLLAACALARSLRVPLGTSPVASCPPLRAPVAGTQLCLRAVPSFLDHAPGVPLPLQLRQRDAWRRALGRRGADVPRPPRGEVLGGERLGGAGVCVGGVGVGTVLRALPTHCCCCGGRRRGARGPCGSVTRFRGMLGAAAWPAEAVARLAGATVATPRAPSPLPCAAAAALGDAPGSCAGATPRVGGVPGATVGAAAWLAGAAVSAPRASGAPSWGGAAGLAVWAAGAVTSADSRSWVEGPVLVEAAWGSPACGPTSTAHSASLRSPRSAGVSPAQSRGVGERERDRRWWRSSRWWDPSEYDITVILVGMRGGRCALPTTSRCISVVPWAVLCSALQGGGGEGVGGRLWRQPRTGGGWWPSIGIGRGGGGATRPTRRATAPILGRGSGPWAPGGRRVVLEGAALGGPP